MNGIKRVTPQTEFGRIGFADNDCPRRTHTGHHDIVSFHKVVFKNRRSHRGFKSSRICQILNRDGFPVQGPTLLHRHLIRGLGQFHQIIWIRQTDNGVHPCIISFNRVQRRLHFFNCSGHPDPSAFRI